MDRLNFIGGAYSSRSSIGSQQRCVNYYPEFNPKDSSFPVTLYQRPGLRQIAVGEGPWRALYQASNGVGYGVSGSKVYLINSNLSLTQIGSVTPGRSNICSMVDNGIQAMLVDGTTIGWKFDIADGSGFQQIVDGTGTFQGADRVDTLDTYILWNMPGTQNFGSTLSGSITFDGLYFAGKVGYPDLLQSLIVNRRELLLMGAVAKSEIWYNAGNVNLPFAELPGAYIEHGLLAKYSLASTDISVFWLHKDLNGMGMVLRQRGYETKRISNYGVEYAIRKMAEAGNINDAIGWCYQQDGHVFYVLTFPSGDQTWVYDDSVGDPEAAWHQQAWTDADGLLHRHRGNCYASLYGKNVVGDWENGSLYVMDPEYYHDQVNAGAGLVEGPISWIRGFPHLLAGTPATSPFAAYGNFVPSNGRAIHHQAFWLSVEAGTNPGQDVPGEIGLRWSDDWGKTFGNTVLVSAGALGEYSTMPQWPGTGLARFRLYEISHSIPGPVALNGAWVQGLIQELNR